MIRHSLLVCCSLIVILSIFACAPGSEKATSTDNPAMMFVAEGRGTWIGMSRQARDWEEIMEGLAKAGINMVFPCMNTGGAAIYPSDVVPMISEGDELAACIAAAHKHGIEVHVWRINWYMSRAPQEFAQRMMDEGRIQYSWDGKRNGPKMKEIGYDQSEDWLCPSHPANRELEKAAMLELVEKYDVDGVHFDYMRFSNEHFCYCDGCRERFEAESGLSGLAWPADVWLEGRYRELYLDWRRNLIHSSARDIARAVHLLDPYVCVSLAGRATPSWCTSSDGQEWWKWMDEGILDILCAMNYASKEESFRRVMTLHAPLIRDTGVPYYSGLGLYEMDSLEQMTANIATGRELGQDGWITFELRAINKHLDRIGAELNARPALLPHRAPRTRFYLGEPDGYNEEGFAQYSGIISGEVAIALTGKLKEGIAGISGEIWLENTDGERLSRVADVMLNKAARLPLSCEIAEPGRYRLGFYGIMTLSGGETRPFGMRSFPFEKISG